MIRALSTALLLTVLALPALGSDKDKSKSSPEGSKTTGAQCDASCCSDECSQRVFELRTYYTNDGKLADLHKRFRDHTCQLLKKHGAELIGFWTPQDEKDGKGSKLVYLVAFPSREAAKKTWKAFGDDPKWKKVYAESHKNGVLVKKVESVYLDPTDYSATK